MSALRIILLVLTYALCYPAGAASLEYRTEAKDNYSIIVISNDEWTLKLLDPSSIKDQAVFGARFCRGTWLQSLSMNLDGSELLRTKTVLKWHPAWGLAQDFELLDQESSDDRELVKIGVGLVRRKNNDRFRDELLQTYPWEQELIKSEDGSINLHFVQRSPVNAPLQYQLELTLHIQSNMTITIEHRLKNLGNYSFSFSNCFHPFLESAPDAIQSRIILSAESDSAGKTVMQYPYLKEIPLMSADKSTVFVRGINKAKMNLSIHSTPAPDKLIFWKSHYGNCFAIEPYFEKTLPSGTSCQWTQKITPEK